jgi:hypothetical protein
LIGTEFPNKIFTFLAFTQFIKSGVFFIAPALVAIFVHDDSNGNQWHIIFYMTAASLVIVNSFRTRFEHLENNFRQTLFFAFLQLTNHNHLLSSRSRKRRVQSRSWTKTRKSPRVFLNEISYLNGIRAINALN